MKEFDRTNNNGFYNANEPVKAMLQTVNNTLGGFLVKHPWRIGNWRLVGCVEDNSIMNWLVAVQKALMRFDPENQVMKIDLEQIVDMLHIVTIADNGEPLAYHQAARVITGVLGRKPVDMCYAAMDEDPTTDYDQYDKLFRAIICQTWTLVAYMISRTGQVEWLENWRDTKESTQNQVALECSNFLELRNDSKSFARDYMLELAEE